MLWCGRGDSGCRLHAVTRGDSPPSPGSSHLSRGHVEWLGLESVARVILSIFSSHSVGWIMVFSLLACLKSCLGLLVFSMLLLCGTLTDGKKGDLGGTPHPSIEVGSVKKTARAQEDPGSLKIPNFLPYRKSTPGARLTCSQGESPLQRTAYLSSKPSLLLNHLL